MSARFETIVFDFDGTLVDSAPDIAESLNELLAQRGVAPIPEAAARLMVGGGVRKLLERAWASKGVAAPASLDDDAADFVEIYEKRPLRLSRPYPQAEETLRMLQSRRIALGLCTNKPERITRTMLAGLGWTDIFGAVVGGDTTPFKKPDPAPVRACLAGVGGRTASAILVGDSEHDLHAARMAGLGCILVTHGYSIRPVAEFGADGVIDSLAALPALLEEFGRAGDSRQRIAE